MGQMIGISYRNVETDHIVRQGHFSRGLQGRRGWNDGNQPKQPHSPWLFQSPFRHRISSRDGPGRCRRFTKAIPLFRLDPYIRREIQAARVYAAHTPVSEKYRVRPSQ